MSLENMNDARLVAQAQTGDLTAFSGLVDAHYRAVCGVAYSAVGDWLAAEDVAQETFLVAWTHLATLRAPAAFGGWLRRIARNLGSNWRRSAQYRRLLEERREDLRGATPSAAPAPDASAERAEARAEIWRALEGLSAPLREAVTLYYLEGRSTLETARALEVSENAVKKRLQHARVRLRRHFEARWQLELDVERERLAALDKPSYGFLALAALGPVDPNLALNAAAAALGKGAGGTFSALQDLFEETAMISAKKAAIGAALALTGLGLWIGHRALNENRPESQQAAQTVERFAIAQPPVSPKPASAPAATTARESAATAPTLTTTMSASASASGGGALPPMIPFDGASRGLIMGRVTSGDGDPIAGANIRVLAIGEDANLDLYGCLLRATQDAALQKSAATDADGRYVIENLSFRGYYQVLAAAQNYCDGSKTLNSPLREDNFQATADFSLEPGMTVEGRLLGPKNDPVPNALLKVTAFATTTTGGYFGSSYPCAITQIDGSFTIAVPGPGTGVFEARSISYGISRIPKLGIAADRFLELRIPAAARLHGLLSKSDGFPAAEHKIRLSGLVTIQNDLGSSFISVNVEGGETTTDAEGRFQFDALVTDVIYRAEISDPTGAVLISDVKIGELNPGEDRNWDFTIANDVVITGVLRGKTTGAPMGGVTVECARMNGPEAAFHVENIQKVKTEEDGSFSIALSQGEGRYRICPFYDRGGNGVSPCIDEQSATIIDARRGENPPIAFFLPEPWTWRIRLVNDDGEIVHGAQLSVSERVSRESGTCRYSRQYASDDNVCAIAGLPPLCEISLGISANGYAYTTSARRVGQPAEISPVQTIVLHRTAELRATLVDENGAPLAGYSIELNVTAQNANNIMPPAGCVISQNGRVAFTGLPAATEISAKLTAHSVASTTAALNLDSASAPQKDVILKATIATGPESLQADLGTLTLAPGQVLDLGVVPMRPQQ